MQRTIKFIKGGSSSVFGNFAPGDILKCSQAQGEHFVEDAACAEWADRPADEQDNNAVAAKPARRKKGAE